MCLRYRCAELQITSGSYEPMMRKYGVRHEEAAEMDRQANEALMPSRLRSMYSELPALEKEIDNNACKFYWKVLKEKLSTKRV